jgi:cytochrome c-type biogenesis protein CcmH/NrfG
VGLAAAGAAAVAGFLMVLGNVPLTHAWSAAVAGDWRRSAREARTSIRWIPWSSEPWRLLGEADLAQRRRGAAAVALRHGIAEDSRNWQLWFDLAAATTGAESRLALRRASELDPRSPEIAQIRQLGS